MARVAILDPSHPSGVTDVVSDYFPSANTPEYISNPDALINPDVSAVAAVARKYWQGNRGGNALQEMSAPDKATYDAWVAAEAEAAMRSGGQEKFNGQTADAQALRALAKITTDEFNIVRTWLRDFQAEVAAAANLAQLQTGVAGLATLNDRTLAQLKSAILSAIANGDVDE